MRLFLAIQLSPAVREALLTAQDALRRQGRGSFPPPENLHLTLAFLGEAEDPARARAALSEVSCRPFSLAVGGPPGHFGDLWWAGVRADPALEELAVSLQADLRSRGFCQEDRPWLPHITLVRRWRGEVPQVTVPHASMVVRQISLLRLNDTAANEIYMLIDTLSLREAGPILQNLGEARADRAILLHSPPPLCALPSAENQ